MQIASKEHINQGIEEFVNKLMEVKKSLFPKDKDLLIIKGFIENNIHQKDDFEYIDNKLTTDYHIDLVKEIQSFPCPYETNKQILLPLIELDILEKNFPHKRTNLRQTPINTNRNLGLYRANLIETIKNQIQDEEFKGIIPLNPKRLKIKFANKSLSPGVGELLVIALICIVLALFLFGVFGFILGSMGVNAYSLAFLFILIYGGSVFVAENIYVNSIKNYPDIFLVITNSCMHFMQINNNQLDIHHKFDVGIEKLNEIFYGQIDKKTGKLGEDFEIRQDNIVELSGKINILFNKLVCKSILPEFLLPIESLRKIYLSGSV